MNLINTLKKNGYEVQEGPFTKRNVIETQKELVKSGYPFLPGGNKSAAVSTNGTPPLLIKTALFYHEGKSGVNVGKRVYNPML